MFARLGRFEFGSRRRAGERHRVQTERCGVSVGVTSSGTGDNSSTSTFENASERKVRHSTGAKKLNSHTIIDV